MNTFPFLFSLRSLFAVCLLLAAARLGAADDDENGVIDLLFLGHGQREGSGYHFSHVYAPIFNRSLGMQKIRMRYEEDPAVLNDEDLGRADVLMIYANHETLSHEQEAALLRFVEEGGGFVPVHCASACFGDSDAYVDLVGARFASHGMETFTTTIAPDQKDHPIMDGFEGFETTDETYVHADHNEAGRDVLMYRGEEPWTWTREQGEGRVFYTAYGHDEVTWEQEPFHDLLIRGILWVVGEEKREANRALVATLPEIEYVPKDTIPNYRRQVPEPEMALPFEPKESVALSMVAQRFEMELFAAEPDIINPIALAWDERGRLFVAETVDYPNNLDPEQQGNDRITICEDTDGDGKADKFTRFAEGLNVPTSLTPIDGGWIVAQAPYFLFLKDTDGDDRADVKYPINSGWGVSDTHAGPSSLRYGHDNKIWGAVGYSDVQSENQGEFGQGVFRMDPDGGSIEPVGQFTNNTWGLGLSEDFEVFGSTANNAPAFHVPIWRRFMIGRSDALPPQMAAKIDDFTQFFPITDNFLQVDVHGGYTAGAGFNIYTARSFPERYWNRSAFVSEPTGHLLGQFFLEEEGSTFEAHNRGSILASVDEWHSPVFAEVGPDGQLWVADWYNFIIQHNPTPTEERGGFDAETGAGNAYVNPLRDRQKGRIYRIVAKDAKPYRPIDLSGASTERLVATLGNDNMFWRMTAQRKLVRENRREAIPDLRNIVLEDTRVDSVGLNTRVIHAIWSLQGLGAFNLDTETNESVVRRALRHLSAAVRKNAIMALIEDGGEPELTAAASLVDDADDKVRLKALLALGLLPASAENGRELYARRATLPVDPWLGLAFGYAVLENREAYLAEMLSNPQPAKVDLLSLYESVEEVPEYIVAKDFLAKQAPDFTTSLENWRKLPGTTLTPIGLALLDVWREQAHVPSEDELALAQGIINKLDANAQMIFKLKAAGLALEFPEVNEAEYTAYFAKNTFSPNVWGWGSAEAGKEIYAQNCVGCHGGDANGNQSLGAPALAGMDNWYVQTQLQKYHAGLRGTHFQNVPGISMKSALDFLKIQQEPNRQISHLAHYIASLPETAQPATVEGDAQRGKANYATCVACHGEDGQGNRLLGSPKLTGKSDWYLLQQLNHFRDDVRGSDPRDAKGREMALMAKTLADEKAVKDVVAYIQSLNTEN